MQNRFIKYRSYRAAETGENEHQDYQVLLIATDDGMITGTLNSQPNTQYTTDRYRSDDCDPSGYGEGQEYLTTDSLSTDGAGTILFGINLGSSSIAQGDAITATATDPDNNTSQFSACVTVTKVITPTPTNTPGPSQTPIFPRHLPRQRPLVPRQPHSTRLP